jgi:two-component system, NtrC family, sensor kinase
VRHALEISRLPFLSRARLGLGAQVALSVGASIALVITGLTFAAMSLAERRIEASLRDVAEVTAAAVADAMELQPKPVAASTLMASLREFVNAEADLRSITVFHLEDGETQPLASTSALPFAYFDAADEVIRTGRSTWLELTPELEAVIAPVREGGRVTGAVAVVVSLASATRLGRAGRLAGLGAAAVAVLALTVLIHGLVRRLVLAPVERLRRVVAAARAGDLSVRVTPTGDDELGELGAGLNQMLAELHDLHRSLNERVAEATGEIWQRNEQLVRSYESVLQLREALARAERLAAAGQTMATVAHQIGTPLNLASGHVQLLQRSIADPDLGRRLAIVSEQIGRVSTAVRDLLERVRPSSAFEAVDVGALVGRIADAIRPRLPAGGVSLDVGTEASLPRVHADETQLELALLNLVTNALDAMPSGGRLELVARASDDGVTIEVADTGIGIPPEVLPRIFEPWVTTKPRGQGAGLGLSITRDVIAAHGGRMCVRTVEGAGTTFTIDLPAAGPQVTAP